MGKVKTPRRAGASSSSPYDRSSSKPTSAPSSSQKNNVFKFKKDYGQHILKNPGIAEEIVKKAFLRPTDTVLEVGPGTGNLSVRILERAAKLVAVELDPRMGAELTKRVQGKPEQRKLEVLLGDVIKMAELPRFDVLISNTPYQISSPLVFKILGMANPPRCAVLMFQREFSSRLTALPGESLYSRLSVNVQLFAKVTHVMKVGRANFKPPPQVESSVVRIEPYTGRERPQVSWEEWDGMLRVCFNRKNKTMHSAWLGTKEVLAMVERNYKTWCTLNDVPLEDGPLFEDNGNDDDADDDDVDMNGNDQDAEEEEDWAGIMDVDDGQAVEEDDVPEFFKQSNPAKSMLSRTPSRRKKTKVGELVRTKIEKVLRETDLSDKRANKCHQNDFLRLLAAFNAEGIHFSSSGASA